MTDREEDIEAEGEDDASGPPAANEVDSVQESQIRETAQARLKMGWTGRFLGADASQGDKLHFSVIAIVMLFASVLHALRPQQSVLLPVVTAVLGFIAGHGSKGKK